VLALLLVSDRLYKAEARVALVRSFGKFNRLPTSFFKSIHINLSSFSHLDGQVIKEVIARS